MTGTTTSSADLDARRRRILFRSWHRGVREMDLLMGNFADAKLASMNEQDLKDYELLIEVPDKDLFKWVAGKEPVPNNYNTAVFVMLVEFSKENPVAFI